jgi:hypothetical protein
MILIVDLVQVRFYNLSRCFFILFYFNGYFNAGELFLFNYIFIILD